MENNKSICGSKQQEICPALTALSQFSTEVLSRACGISGLMRRVTDKIIGEPPVITGGTEEKPRPNGLIPSIRSDLTIIVAYLNEIETNINKL